jgi:hypothetical protein
VARVTDYRAATSFFLIFLFYFPFFIFYWNMHLGSRTPRRWSRGEIFPTPLFVSRERISHHRHAVVLNHLYSKVLATPFDTPPTH